MRRDRAEPAARRLRALSVNLGLAAGAVALTLLALEVVLALCVEVTDDVEYADLPGVGLRLRPHQEGLYLRAGIDGGPPIRGRFQVNSQGFNNRREYSEKRLAGRRRIAVVGDSFVEALQVDYQETFFHRLERELASAGVDAEVYTFGVSGAGVAHAYHMIDRQVLRYAPDLVVHVFAPNDPTDTALRRTGRRWFPRYDLDAAGELTFRGLDRYRLSFANRLLRNSHLLRFFYFQHHGRARFVTWRRRGYQAAPKPAAADDARARAWNQRTWRLVELLLLRIDRRLASAGVPGLLVWVGHPNPDYHRDKRRRLQAVAARHGLRYFDPSGDFAAAAREGETFRIRGDGHWDRRGHLVLAGALARETLAVLPPPARAAAEVMEPDRGRSD